MSGATIGELSFAYLMADTATNLIWGYLSDKTGFRSTFLVGPNGKVQRAWYNVRADGHAAKVLEEIAAG